MKCFVFLAIVLSMSIQSISAVSWTTSRIDGSTSRVGEFTSIAIDDDGWSHISYYDISLSALKYAYQDSNGWHIDTIDDAGGLSSVGTWSSIDLDENNYPHVCYFYHIEYGGGDYLKYAYKDNSGWHIQTVDECDNQPTAIVIDKNNHPHIVYEKDNEYWYTHYNGLNWEFSFIDFPSLWNGSNIDIDIDNLNRPHVSYQSGGDEQIYAYKNGNYWIYDTIMHDNYDNPYTTSIKVDNQYYPHISFSLKPGTYKDNLLCYAYIENDNWKIDTVDNPSDAGDVGGKYSSLVLDSKGNPHISYYYGFPDELKYAYKDNSGWHIQYVDVYSDVGEWSSIALNVNDEPHISYYDESNQDLRFARPQTYYPHAFNLRLPDNGSWVTSTPSFLWEASSYQGDSLDHYELWVDGSYINSSLATRPFCQISSVLTPGWLTWKVVAIKLNADSIWSNQTWSIRVDTVAPITFNLISPSDSQWVAYRRPTFSWDPSGLDRSGLLGYNLYIDNEIVHELIPPQSTSVNPLWSINDGDYQWYVEAVDTSGNKTLSNQIWTVRIDSTKPLGFNRYYPAYHGYYSDTLTIYKWESTNDTGIGMSHYSLWVDNFLEVESIPADTFQDTIFSQQINPLNHGSHQYYIQAFDLLGNYQQTYSRTFYIDLQPPEEFSLIFPQDISLEFLPTPNFSWHSTSDYSPYSSGFSHYELWIDSAVNIDSLNDTLTAPSSPLSEGYHEWFVKAYDNLGNVRNSSETWVVILDWNPPISFSLSSPFDYDTVDISQPTLFWHPSFDSGSGICKYQLLINGVTNVDSISYSDTSCIPSSSLNNGTYTWNIKAYDYAGGSVTSNETWHIIVCKDTINPTIPNLISPVDSLNTQDTLITFIWNSSTDPWSGIDYYEVKISYDLTFTSIYFDTNTVDTTINTIFADSLYFWRVRAIDKAANSSEWSEIRYFTIDNDIPSVPSLIYPVGGTWVGDNLICFQWIESIFEEMIINHPTNNRNINFSRDNWISNNLNTNRSKDLINTEASPIRYIIEIDSLINLLNPIIVDTIDTVVFEQNLPAGGYYYWHVKAYDLAGNESPYSGVDSFGVDVTAPVIESTTVIPDTTTIGPFTIDVHITDNVGLDSCLIFYKRSSDPDWISDTLSSTGGDWYSGVIPIVQVEDTVKYYIFANDIAAPANESTDPAGAPGSYYSFIVNALGTEENITAIPRIYGIDYNSPAVRQMIFRLAIPEITNIRLKIYDLSGRLVSMPLSSQLTPGYHQVQFRPENKGVYFYSIESEHFNDSGKFIVVN